MSKSVLCWGPANRRHRAIEFRRFLDQVDAAVPARFRALLSLDNYSTHKTPRIRRWLAQH